MLCVVNTLLCAMFRPANAEKKEFSKTKIGKWICIYIKAMDSVNITDIVRNILLGSKRGVKCER